MPFKLNEQHLEIMQEVRANLRTLLTDEVTDDSDGREYICVQVIGATSCN